MGKYIKPIIVIIVVLLLSFECNAETDSDKTLNEFLTGAPSEFSNITELSEITDKINLNSTFGFIVKTLGSQMKNCSGIFITYVVIILLFSLLKNTNFSSKKTLNNIVASVASLTVFAVSITTLQTNIELMRNAVESMKIFSSAAVPVVITLAISCGESYSAAIFSAAVSFGSAVFEYITDIILFPLVVLFLVFGIMSNMSDELGLSSFGNHIKKFIKWLVGAFIGLFTVSLSLQNFLSKASDNIAKRTIKSAVSSFIPIVGSTLSGSIDNLFALGNGTKTSFAILGVIIIASIFLPLIIGNICYGGVAWLSKAISSFLGISKIEKTFGSLADTFFILAAICSSGVYMMIVSFLLLCISVG